MKARVEHRIPSSKQALMVLQRPATQKVNDVVLSGQKAGRALSNMGLLMMLRRMGRDDLTAHCFRSKFRGLGSRAHRRCARGRGGGVGTRRSEQGRGGLLSAQRSVRKTA
jgi:hypothetical protein